MYELGCHVPVVPVVTKADTMTIREANTYRTEVANRIANPMVPGRLHCYTLLLPSRHRNNAACSQ